MDKFSFWQKWFWVGIVVSVFSAPAGLVYGLALLVEPEHRKEGLAITAWSLVWTAIIFAIILKTKR